ncbi:lycopene cyclase family protein [Flavobacteriaceae bacterium M23B6Z8]
MKSYDYIIVGAGAAGLQLAYFMAKDPFFTSRKILVLDSNKKTQNDRTWCFWEKEKGIFENILYKTWDSALFASSYYTSSIKLAPYRYKMIRGIDFYEYVLSTLHKNESFDIRYETVKDINDQGSFVRVETNIEGYSAKKVFSSVFDPKPMLAQKDHPVLQQHFIGWFVKTERPVFNPEEVTFMDFTVTQKGNTRFMYVLPFSKHEALVEYTLFSEDLLPQADYENAIKEYLLELEAGTYEITDTERGSVPMTTFDFKQGNTPNFIKIGTAGGWTKASTGYTFKNTQQKASLLVSYLKEGRSLKSFNAANRFTFYDGILLDILQRKNHLGAFIFSKLFKRNKAEKIFKFLEDKTSLPEEIRIMASVADIHFTMAFFRYLIKGFRRN